MKITPDFIVRRNKCFQYCWFVISLHNRKNLSKTEDCIIVRNKFMCTAEMMNDWNLLNTYLSKITSTHKNVIMWSIPSCFEFFQDSFHKLGCLFLFSGLNFLVPKKRSWQDSWGFLFFLRFPEEFFTGTWFWRGHRNSCFFSLPQDFFAGIPAGQEFLNLLWIPPESGGFLQIPVPANCCLARPATKEGSLLSKIWTEIDLFQPLSWTGLDRQQVVL